MIKTVAEKCNQCGICADDCSLIKSIEPLTPLIVAEKLIHKEIDEVITDFIKKCSLCGLCTAVCPANINLADMIREARNLLITNGTILAESYRFIWVDHEWNVFSVFKSNYQTDTAYKNWYKEKCDVLFFPGCMLLNEAPHLVRLSLEWMEAHGEDVGLMDLLCCGAPIAEVGMKQRADAYLGEVWNKIKQTGARRVITVCPTCHLKLSSFSIHEKIEIQSLFQVMAQSGLKVPVSGIQKITIHDSCSDRWGHIGKYVREILKDNDVREMTHRGQETICCGSGGIVSQVSSELCQSRADRRLREIKDVGADVCVTYCMACAHRLSDGNSDTPITHLLEFVFNSKVDHRRYDEMVDAMWQGEIADYNLALIQNSKKLNFAK